MEHPFIYLFIFLILAYGSDGNAAQMVGRVVNILRIRHVVLITANSQVVPKGLHTTDVLEDVLSSLWVSGVQVTVFQLPSAFANSSAPEAPGDNILLHGAAADEGAAGASAEDASLQAALSATDDYAGVLLLGDVDWVTSLAILMNKKMLLGPNNILLLHPWSGRLTEKILEPNIRLAAQVIVLDAGTDAPAGTSPECVAYVRDALLLSGGTYAFRTAGCWYNDGRGLVLRRPILAETKTLRGANVIVVIVKNFFEAIRVGPRRAHLVGYLGKVINALSRSLDFRYTIMEGASFGSKAANGSFDGVVGHIERKEGDVGLATLSITHSRYQSVDYTSWLQFHPSLFVTRGPRYLKDPYAVFRLYTWQGWSAISGFLVFSALWLWVLWSSVGLEDRRRDGTSNTGGENPSPEGRGRQHKDSRKPSFGSVLATVLKAIVYQGSFHTPDSSPARLVYVCLWLVVVMVVAVYSGNLTAFLSSPVISRPPTTIRQLVTRDWTIRLDKAYGSHDQVKDTMTEDYQTLYRRAKERGSILENKGATIESKTDINELKKKDIALVMGETGAFYTMNVNSRPDGGCTLAYSQEAVGKEFAALALPKQSLLKPMLDRKLRWMRQMGVLHQYYKDSFGVKCHQTHLGSSEPSGMALGQLMGVFYVWVAGIGISCFVFLGEIYVGLTKLEKRQE